MYLVKWAGLGYEFCTWETKEDINDDGLIAEFHRLNNMTPDEPDLTEEEVSKVLDEMKHVSHGDAGGMHCIPDLRVQLYAQSRAFQFGFGVCIFGFIFENILCIGELLFLVGVVGVGVGVGVGSIWREQSIS
jgi:hypothetical protein